MVNVLEIIDGGFIGGGQTHILSLVNCLDEKKYKALIAASGKGGFRNEVKKNGFNFAEIELPKFYRSKYLRDLDKIVKENSIDIIHSHGGVAGMYARFYKKKYGNIKTVHTIHGIHYLNSGNLFRRYFSLMIEQYLVQYTDKFICVSEADLKTAAENRIADTSKTTVINNGIDLKKFSEEKGQRNNELTKKYDIKEEDLIIGNVSRFDFQKNQRFIIANSVELLKKYPNVKILLAGNGGLFEQCIESAKDTGMPERFIFTGEITNAEDYYPLIDIYVFPSLWEGLSISLIEAMATGRCILASDIEANKELITDRSNGLLFNTDDPVEYLKRLHELIDNKNLRTELSEKALKESLEYSEEKMSGKIMNEYSILNTQYSIPNTQYTILNTK
ncbi:MAG TPA: glycosyltransferase [Ignavibacteria bacterium]|nr:glycosyltransferase [Ignavibacteria bacterium]HMR39499.1 glycosyltransferase [Ignavibacteria bacterium]